MQKLSRKKHSRAFTLIELLVTIALIGIMASATLIVLNPLKRSQQARDAIRKTHLAEIQDALEIYYAENNGYPNTGGLVGWPTNYWRWSSDPQPWIPDLVPKYIKQVPIDPKNCCERPFLLGNYEYAYSSN